MLHVAIASIIGTLILVLLVDPAFTRKVALIYFAAGGANWFLLQALKAENYCLTLLVVCLISMSLFLAAWWSAWKSDWLSPQLSNYRTFQTKIWGKIRPWL